MASRLGCEMTYSKFQTIFRSISNPNCLRITQQTCFSTLRTKPVHVDSFYIPERTRSEMMQCLRLFLPNIDKNGLRKYSVLSPNVTNKEWQLHKKQGAVLVQKLFKHTDPRRHSNLDKSVFLYCVSLMIVALGVSYLAVPLYRVFCQVRKYLKECVHLY